MSPVICFYKNDQYLYSSQYTTYCCHSENEATEFLLKMNSQYNDKYKIIKINFDCFQSATEKNEKLVATPLIIVYVLNEYEIVNLQELKNKHQKTKHEHVQFASLITEEEFKQSVESILTDIKNGRFYQINLTSAFKAQTLTDFDTLSFFIDVADKIYCPYKAYLPFESSRVMCFSPELFLQKENDYVITQPIKGTLLPNQSVKELTFSQKEESELSMIVDLLRNDLNSLTCSEYKDTARVQFHRKLLDLNYTTHTFSEVAIKTSLQLPQILEKIFPGGSISGCPKIESLAKIGEIEKFDRDFYTGSIGWWHQDNFKLNIAIRSFIHRKNELYYFAGCGIVYDSTANSEWTEFFTKAKFLTPLKQENILITDTLLFKNDQIEFLNEHIERTIESFFYYHKRLSLNKIKSIYERISIDLKNKLDSSKLHKVKIQFPLHLDGNYYTYTTELFNVDNDKTVLLSLSKASENFVYSSIKTNLRAHWDEILKSKPADCDDVLIINKNNHIVETSIYSIFYKLENQFYTPPLDDGCLNGVLRKSFLKQGYLIYDNVQYHIKIKSLNYQDLKNVELYVGNSVRGIKKAKVIHFGF